MEKEYAIKVENLTKKFNHDLTAVDGISFSVEKGEIFGLLGPNGAGKTTTINMLSTMLEKTSGYAELAGYDISKSKDDVRRSIGVVFQDPALDTKLTGRENLEFHSMMYGIPKKERDERIGEVLALVELTDKADTLVEKYSGGMKRRLEIARGLIHRPKVLFLDEPTLGLDTQTRRHIWEYVKKLNKEIGTTIILTTHYMEEADFLCSRIAIIDHGKIVALGTPDKLKEVLGGDVISLQVSGDAGKFLDIVRGFEWIKGVKQHDGFIDLTVNNGEKRIPEVVCIAPQIPVTITSVNLRRPSLEDVFLNYTGRTIREQEGDGMDNARMRMRRRV